MLGRMPRHRWKDFGSLLDEHAPTHDGGPGAFLARPERERRRLRTVGQVVAQCGRADRGVRIGWRLALQAGGGRIDEQIVGPLGRHVVEVTGAQESTPEACHDGLRAIEGAVRDDHRVRAAGQQRADDAESRAARAEHQDAPTLQREAQVPFEVAREPDAVGVVTEDLTVLEGQRVHRPSLVGTLAQLVAEFGHRHLVRDGDVQALAAGALELAYRLLEFFRRNLQEFVTQLLAGLHGEQLVDDR